jgi:hypothetical protein
VGWLRSGIAVGPILFHEHFGQFVALFYDCFFHSRLTVFDLHELPFLFEVKSKIAWQIYEKYSLRRFTAQSTVRFPDSCCKKCNSSKEICSLSEKLVSIVGICHGI